MSIRTRHAPLNYDGREYNFDHIEAFHSSLDGHGRDGEDIRIRVSFQSHVYSEACSAFEIEKFADEGNKFRKLCTLRYNLSLELPNLCESCIGDNWLTWESKDRNRVSNLMTVDIEGGQSYAIVYRLTPSLSDHHDVELIVKSAYPKDNMRPNKRKFNVKQLIKRCYFQNVSIP